MSAQHHVHRRMAHQDSELHAKELRDVWKALGDPLHNHMARDGRTSTVYVYYTQAATFSGETGALVTQTDGLNNNDETALNPPQAQTTPAAISAVRTSILAATSAKSTSHSVAKSGSSTGTPTAILPGTALTSVATTLVVASATQNSAKTTSAASAASGTATAVPTAEGMSTGGKVGLVLGIVLGMCAAISLIFFCLRKRRQAADRERLQDEKSLGNNAAFAKRSASVRTTATAPRLSLRPVSKFTGNLLAGAGAGTQQRGNEMVMSQGAGNNLSPGSAWERPSTSASQDRNNPFGNHNELDDHNAAGAPVVATGPGGAYSANSGAAAAAGAVAGTAAGIGLARGASKRGNAPANLDLTRGAMGSELSPPSPTGTDYSGHSAAPGTPIQTGGAAAIAAAGGPQNSAVHRVQLDFKPSMDDELGLKAGQLIRLLHEYDDGWALCIRLDRSQQGVCPRTCLSTRPVKPRPNGPPPSQSARGPGGPGPQYNRPGSANSMRGPPQGPPRPGSAQSQRGPGPQHNRPGSANGQNRGPGPQFRGPQGPPRPGSANSMRGPDPMRPGSSNGMRRGDQGPMYRPDGAGPQNPAMIRSQSPARQGQMHNQPQSPPRAQQAQMDMDVPVTEHKMAPSPMELVKKWQEDEGKTVVANNGHRPASPSMMQSQNISPEGSPQGGHRVRPSVDRKPVPGMAL